MINVSEIEEYLYCPRQWFYHKQGISIDTDILKQGRFIHKDTNNIFLQNNKIKGILDKIEDDKIIEIKRTTSHSLFQSHKTQLLSYLYLANENGFNIKEGIVRYQNKDFLIRWNRKEKKYLDKIIDKIQTTRVLPPRCEKIQKCNRCSLKTYCWV